MSYVKKLLAPGERIVFTGRKHWLLLLPALLIDVALAIVIVAFSVGGFLFSPPYTLFGLLLLLVPLGHFLYRLIAWRSDQYIVTDRRVMDIRGAFDKYVSESSLDKINDVVMQQSALGRVFNYGDVRIITGSDVGIDVFRRIARPIQFKTAMLAARTPPAGPSAGVPELLAQLEDLRQRGVITDKEFETEKRQLLERR